jgi:S1-C subfamily serine protease
MMRFRLGFAVILCALVTAPALGEEPKLTKAEVAKRGKPSVAFVLAKIEAQTRPTRPAVTAQGSAFCVHPSGLFVTNSHVIENATEIELVVNPSQKDQKVFKATVVRKLEKEDLALLRVETKEELPALPLGDDTALEELADVVACGYPFGSAMTFGTKEYPSITTTAGGISSLRKKGGELELIQLDVSLNPGNSGGPILDMHGKVIGVALGGIKGTQVNFAIPVRRVAAFLAEPEFSFTPPAIRLADRGKPVAVEARLISFVPGGADAEMELEVRRGKTPATRHPMKLEKGTYKADVVLLPERKEATKCAVEVSFADGSLAARLDDRTVKIGEASHKLSELRTISPSVGKAVLWSGERLEGKVTGLESVAVTLGGREITIDLSVAQEIASQRHIDEPVIVLEVVARRSGKELGRLSRSVVLDDANKVYLVDLTPFETRVGPWPFTVGKLADTDSSPLKVMGRLYPKGMCMHTANVPVTAHYRLAKTASLFRTTVAFNDQDKFKDGIVTGPTTFEVYGDGKLLWKSKAINNHRQLDECSVDVSGVDVLELRVGNTASNWGASSVWLDPILIGPDADAIRKAASKK